MTQQINLFNPIFLKQKKIFSAVNMLDALALLLVGIALFVDEMQDVNPDELSALCAAPGGPVRVGSVSHVRRVSRVSPASPVGAGAMPASPPSRSARVTSVPPRSSASRTRTLRRNGCIQRPAAFR